MSHSINLPRIMQVGKNARSHLPEILNSLGAKRPLIITDKMMVSLGYIDQIQNLLKAENIESDYFDETIPEPTSASIEAGVNHVKTHQYDAIIAVGGGSPIDSAKAISILSKFGGEIRDYKFPRQVNEIGLPIIAIPTTAGTGSECTRFTIITDDKTSEKMLCAGLGFLPIAAIIDYELTMSLPARTTADTGIDALTHAIEAYVSKKASPYSDAQAIAAMKLIGPNLQIAYHEPGNESAREKMMLGSTFAGIAFSNASVALVHGMSRPIGAFFHVPHGLSNAMLLPMITEFSIQAAPERYADCAKAMGVAHIDDSHEVANQKLVQALAEINKDLKVPTLAEFGVDRKYFDEVVQTMAEQAIASGSPSNNPITPTIAEMISLYKQLW
ncbi:MULTISPECIES: iron-containing alcohol dehydrogenase [Acinetobacter]|jgi:alcohol dehydrogenase class IV|uniref:Alcohol dehydrogenase n=4 Tax=Acinetobacter TaxID=469 RepID=A0A2H9YUK7_9GAMM|nr:MULTISPECIES: iron-containing alcohol dehydrogenase [Acinetobacter]NWK50204.1 iron-containing alcohol dehydrogenase [Acinetobacter sp. SwsAc7]OFW97265.1 MAG: alcohol dehydrogenase [Acinetobacter sp. RIFCSPHIGHO2_12_41_5]OHC24490.1 MAG: alcohol dehydrogenase [Pseudomonadales bacterium RIFCSPHIGHO2_12_FULL_40_16]EEY97732.1 putative NADPH-dependent butanol dehydrogenase [Acinetobacter johnsonii SH046]MCF7643036.1 iron-containing alcohol dehydrogenase [Acinetobacter johnsonii]